MTRAGLSAAASLSWLAVKLLAYILFTLTASEVVVVVYQQF